MKRFLKIFLPIVLSLAIIAGIGWYLFSYDPLFTQDVLLSGARHFSDVGNHKLASWLYDRAYNQSYNMEEISIELAEGYVEVGNYTKAEVALNRAIKDGAKAPVYICLSKIYIEQDKILDAIQLLDKIPDSDLKKELDGLRPAAPTTNQEPGLYNQYISVTIDGAGHQLYVNKNGQYPSVGKDLYAEPIRLVDGENILYAVSISEKGLPSPLSVFSYTIGGIIEDIAFQDTIIEQDIRKILSISDNRPIKTNELWNIKEYTIPEHAKNYTDLQYMIHLESLVIDGGVSDQLKSIKNLKELKYLTITDTNISADDLDAISQLTGLTELTLDNCGISTITSLSTLTELTKLKLNNNAIRNLAPIGNLTKLEELEMQRNVLVDLSPITTCAFLRKLNLSYNTIVSIAPLGELNLLNYLDVSHNEISDISALQKMAELNELYVNNNSITDISPVVYCEKLARINISNNNISDLTPTLDLKHVTHLNFSHNQVTDLPKWSKSNSFITVDGSYNQISDLSVFSGHETINNILMDYNENIESIDMLADCHVLIQVNVYGTKVSNVEKLTEQSIIVNYNPVEEE